jgi:hypothetical protein
MIPMGNITEGNIKMALSFQGLDELPLVRYTVALGRMVRKESSS